MTSSARVLILGATGFTGRLVARELAAMTAVPFAIAGRDEAKLSTLAENLGHLRESPIPYFVTSPMDPVSLAASLRGCEVVINCIGPFSRLGEPVVRAAIEAGCHYIDTTGEQHFMAQVITRYDAPARAASVTVVNAMAFEYALGCCAAALLVSSSKRPVREVDIVYSWRMGPRSASVGTRRSVFDVLGRRTMTYEGGELRALRVASRNRPVDVAGDSRHTAMSFPAGEIVTLPRHLQLETVRAWLVTDHLNARVMRLTSPILPIILPVLGRLLDPLIRRGPDGPDVETRQSSEFTIVAEADPLGADRITVRGRDPYGLTAVIAVRGALRCIGLVDSTGALAAAHGPPPPTGVIDPAQLMDPESFLDHLEPWDLQWARG